MLTQSPYLLYADDEGNIFEDTSLYVLGRTGWGCRGGRFGGLDSTA
jgi:hypothetical protein